MATTQRIRIQNFLVELARSGVFYPVTYTKGIADPIDIGQSTRQFPGSALCNEINAEFRRDEDYGRSLKLKRVDWQFELLLMFNREVTFEFFERAFMDKPPILEAGEGFEQATLMLDSAAYEHPPQQTPANGSKATMKFTAVLGRN
jgi:hypothetical protein